MSKTTHQSTFGTHRDVVAWQYDPKAEMPDWVAKTIKDCSIKAGDWVIADPSEGMATILHDNEFQRCFRPI